MPSQKLIELLTELQFRVETNSDGMRQGDTLTLKRLRALQTLETAAEQLPASAQKTILQSLITYFVNLEEEIEFWSD